MLLRKHVDKYVSRGKASHSSLTSAVARTFTSSFRYTFSLFGAVRQVFLLRPPASRSIPCAQKEFGSARHVQVASLPRTHLKRDVNLDITMLKHDVRYRARFSTSHASSQKDATR